MCSVSKAGIVCVCTSWSRWNLHKTYPRYMYTNNGFLTFPVPRIHVCSCMCKCVTPGAYVGHMHRTRVGLS